MTLDNHIPRDISSAPLGSVKSKKSKILKHEKNLAERGGGKVNVNSGAREGYKGDFVLEDFLGDDKSTDKFSYRVDADFLAILCRQANQVRKSPLLTMTFNKADGIPKEWAVIPYNVFLKLIGKA